jgi:hypothetical protein
MNKMFLREVFRWGGVVAPSKVDFAFDEETAEIAVGAKLNHSQGLT